LSRLGVSVATSIEWHSLWKHIQNSSLRLAQEFLALEIAASRFLGHNLIKLFLILADQPLPSFLEAFSVFGFTGFEQDTFGSLA